MEWFVYSDATYYPSAGIVEAETAEEAIGLYWNSRADTGLVASPLDAIAAIAPVVGESRESVIAALRRDAEP